jgi:IclR family pca regulon transcriptional regulator
MQDQKDLKENYFINSLARGMQVLSVFTPDRPNLSVTEISNITEMPQSTIFRLVYTLEHLGYLVRDDATRRYEQSVAMLSIGLAVRENLNIRTIAQPFVQALSEATNESAKIAILQGTEIMLVIVVEAANKLTLRTPIGHRSPAYCTALGKVLLAYQPKAVRDEIADSIEFVAHTDRTIRNKAELITALDSIQTQGYTHMEEEFVLGMNSIAAPIFDDAGQAVAAVNVSALLTAHMVPEKETQLIEAVVDCAAQISTALGYQNSRQPAP